MSADRGGLQVLLDLGDESPLAFWGHTDMPDQPSPLSPEGERGFCHAPFRVRATTWPKRLDSIGATPTLRCEWLTWWVRVIKPVWSRTSSLGSDSPPSQDSDATFVERRTSVHDGPAFPRRTTRPDTPGNAKRCVSSNPATDSRNRAPAGCSAPGGPHARVALAPPFEGQCLENPIVAPGDLPSSRPRSPGTAPELTPGF
jgi:hypothetical protein